MGILNASAALSKPSSISSMSKNGSEDNIGMKALFYCSLLALQYGLQPLLVKKFSAPDCGKNSIVIATELSKIGLAAMSLSKEPKETRDKIVSTWSLIDYMKIVALPAALYGFQNLLMQYGYAYLDGMTVNLLNQTKTLSAAFFLYFLLDNKQSIVQMFALVLLFVAAALLTGGDLFTMFTNSSNDSTLPLLLPLTLGLLYR